MMYQSNTTKLYYVYYCIWVTCFNSYRVIFRPFYAIINIIEFCCVWLIHHCIFILHILSQTSLNCTTTSSSNIHSCSLQLYIIPPGSFSFSKIIFRIANVSVFSDQPELKASPIIFHVLLFQQLLTLMLWHQLQHS